MQQQPYMHGTAHPQNPNVYVQQMSMMPSSQQQNYQMQQSVESPMMSHQMGQGGQQQQNSMQQQQSSMPQQPNIDPQMQMRFVRPQQIAQGQSSTGPASNAQELANEPANRPAAQTDEMQQHAAEAAANAVPKAPSNENPTAETMGFKSLDQYGPLALCTLGKDVTREIVNQSGEFFKICKSLQLSYPLPQPGQQNLNYMRSHLDKQDRAFKNFNILFERLGEISAKVDEQYVALIPLDASAQDLIPFADCPNNFINKFKENNSEYDRLKIEHQQTKDILQQKQDELKGIIDFLSPTCWDSSNIMSHLSS